MILFPDAGGEPVCFRHGGIDVYCAKNFIEPDPMFHRGNIFGDEFASMVTHDSDAKDTVFPRFCKYLYHSLLFPISDGPVKLANLISSYLVSNRLFLCFLFVESNPRDFWVRECAPRDDTVIDLKLLKWTE